MPSRRKFRRNKRKTRRRGKRQRGGEPLPGHIDNVSHKLWESFKTSDNTQDNMKFPNENNKGVFLNLIAKYYTAKSLFQGAKSAKVSKIANSKKKQAMELFMSQIIKLAIDQYVEVKGEDTVKKLNDKLYKLHNSLRYPEEHFIGEEDIEIPESVDLQNAKNKLKQSQDDLAQATNDNMKPVLQDSVTTWENKMNEAERNNKLVFAKTKNIFPRNESDHPPMEKNNKYINYSYSMEHGAGDFYDAEANILSKPYVKGTSIIKKIARRAGLRGFLLGPFISSYGEIFKTEDDKYPNLAGAEGFEAGYRYVGLSNKTPGHKSNANVASLFQTFENDHGRGESWPNDKFKPLWKWLKDSPGATAWKSYAVTMDLNKIFNYFMKTEEQKKNFMLYCFKEKKFDENACEEQLKGTQPVVGGRKRRRRKRRTRRGGKSRRRKRTRRRRRR